MMKNKILCMATGSVMGISLSAGIANADVNPFEMQKVNSGYSMAMSDTPDEAKCGANKAKAEAKCGGEKAAMDKSSAEGKCGAKEADKMPEAKCGGNK